MKSSMTEYFNAMQNFSGLAEFLNYAWILEDGVIANKDGSLSMHFEYFAADMESQEDYSINMLVTKIFRALSYLDQGWLFEENLICNQQKSYSKVNQTRDMVTDLIDQERENLFLENNNIYQNQYYISFTYKASKRSLDDLRSKIYIQDDIQNADKQTLVDKEFINKFKEEVQAVIDLLQADGIFTTKLEDKYLYQFLKNMVNCSNEPVAPFDYKSFTSRLFLDESLAQSELKTGSELKLDDKYLYCISLDDIPNHYYPTILNSLNVMRMSFRFSARFNYLSSTEINKVFKTKHTQWSFKLFGSVKNFITSLFESANEPIKEDAHAREMITDIELAKIREKYGSKFGLMTLTLLVWDEDRDILKEKVAEIKNILRQENFTARVEKVNATNSYFGSLVSHGSYNARANPVELELFVNMLSTTGIYQGSQYSTCSFVQKQSPALIECMTSHGYRKFYFNLHDKDVGHTKIIGPTGSGKTMLLGLIAASWLKKYDNTRVIGADYLNSMLGITKALGGRYIDITDEHIKLAPFIEVDNEKYTKEFLIPWLKDIYKRSNKNQESGKKENKAIFDSLKSLTHIAKTERTFERFIAQIDDEHTQSIFAQFKKELPFNILSGNSDDIFAEDFCMFNKEPILKMHDSQKFPILDFIYYKQIKLVEKASLSLGQVTPTLMILDEASFEFKDSYMRRKMFEYIKMGRHLGIAIIFTFQSAKDVIGIGDASDATLIDDNIATNIYLPNIKAQANASINEQYQAMGLNNMETQIIANALPNKQYYVVQKIGNKLVDIELGAFALAFFDLTIKDKKDLNHMSELQRNNPNNWAYKWLEYRNVY